MEEDFDFDSLSFEEKSEMLDNEQAMIEEERDYEAFKEAIEYLSVEDEINAIERSESVNNNKIDFDNLSEEEESLIDELVVNIGKANQEINKKPHMVNMAELKKLNYVYKTLKDLFDGSGVEVTYEMFEIWMSSGSVTLVGRDIDFKDAKIFSTCAKLASCIDIYARTDGNVNIEFCFNDLAYTV